MPGSIGYANGSSLAAQPRSQVVDRIFKKVDSNRDGKITKDELTQALKPDTVEIGADGTSANVDKIFNQLDTGNKGYITRQDTADGLDKLPPTLTAGAAASASGGTPKGGGGGGGGGGGAAASITADPADTNQDGKVSAQELLAYIQKQYAKTNSTTSTTAQSITYSG